MLKKPVPSFFTLLMEAFYRIPDAFGTQDILFSFRQVCAHFHAVISARNRYKIQFTSLSPKTNIRRIRGIIPSKILIHAFLQAQSVDHTDCIQDRV